MFGDAPPAVVFVIFVFGLVVLAGVLQCAMWLFAGGARAEAIGNAIHFLADCVRFTTMSIWWLACIFVEQTVLKLPFFARFRNSEIAETPQPKAETAPEIISSDVSVYVALARLIHANELNITTAVKVGFGVKSGEKYQKHSKAINAELDKLKVQFRQEDGTVAPPSYPVTKRAA